MRKGMHTPYVRENDLRACLKSVNRYGYYFSNRPLQREGVMNVGVDLFFGIDPAKTIGQDVQDGNNNKTTTTKKKEKKR